MKTSKIALSVVRIAVLLLGLGMVMPAGAQGQAETVTVAGWFHVIWGDGRPGTGIATERYFLTDDSGHTSPLRVDEETLRAAGGILALNQQRVIVEGDRLLAAPQGAGAAILHVQAIRRDDSAAASAAPAASPQVSGPQPWITIPCKFADVPSENRDLAYFQGMYSSAYPGLDHYWREVSYDAINLTGSAAVGWHTLPQPNSYYVYDMDGDGQADEDLDRMADDCTAVADLDVYFPGYVGINLMFNDDFDTSYGGSSRAMTLDGVTRRWRMTWLADWGYYNASVTAHEMGHAFGLPHSSGAYGMTYDNYWDVMSVASNCIWIGGGTSRDPVYGCLPQHTISFHKDILGWIPEARRRTVVAGERVTIALEQLALPGDGNTLRARIPIADSATHFFTVEARRLTGYDGRSPLPGQAVIIHEVDTRRERPAYVVDTDGNHNTGDDGAMWLPGETFTALADTIMVTVDSATATGFVVTIDNRSLPPIYYVAPGGADDGNTCLDSATPCATVQRAVDVAEPNREIRVAAGTYTGVNTRGGSRQVVYIDKTVTIRGGYATTNWAASDPIARPTTLDAGGQGRVLHIRNSRATLEGLILRGGNAAGLNDLWGNSGGNVFVHTSEPTIRNCVISNGKADSGAGLYAEGDYINLEGNTITFNEAASLGGGLMLTSGAVLKGNIVVSNTAGVHGGGVYLNYTTPYGAAPLQLTNTVIADNTVNMGGGGGLYLERTKAHLAHTTVARNRGGEGTGITTFYSAVVMTNTIVAGHTMGVRVSGGAVTLSGVLWHDNTTNQGGPGSAVVSHAATGDPAFAADGYHLTDSSAAIDTGVDAGITTDMDRQARPGGAGYDLGADENYTFKFVYSSVVF